MKEFLEKLHEAIIDTLFPIFCLACKKEGSWLCQHCAQTIPLKTEQVCGVCEKMITPSGKTCHACKRRSSLDGLLTASAYDHPLTRTLVHHFKYRFIEDLHAPLGDLMTNAFSKSDLPLPDFIIPVPLHARRLRWRGFNQAELLAEQVSHNLTPGFIIPVEKELLKRKRYTPPQMSIAHFHERQKNIRGAFAINEPTPMENKVVLLIDDIATTGSTIFECADVLKKAGARQVFALVIARQSMRKT